MVHSFSDAIFLSLIKEDRFQYLIQGLGMSLKLTLIAAVVGVIPVSYTHLKKAGTAPRREPEAG